MIKVTVILFILIGMAYAAMQLVDKIEEDDSRFQVAIDEATRQAVEKGEFQFSDNIIPIESKDCEGTQWIKQQECSLNGKSMDGTEGSCGPGKEIWILDPNHKDFKPATGDGKCEPQERDCSVECPKPCEGDTWKDTGRCVRREYDTRGNMKEIVLDGTEGKCGEGITEFTLDTTAPDYKPAVGKGECPMTKGGACNVPCPKPEPPKCNSYTGWVENVGLGCVIRENSSIKVNCGQTGVKQSYNIATNSEFCEDLIKWETCTSDPCPIDCEGSWSGWSGVKSDEPCGVQPYKEKTYTITTQAQHGGRQCDYTHGDTRTKNAGSVTPCCKESGDWVEERGSCDVKGLSIYKQAVKENKPGGCPDSAKTKLMPCCYPMGDWTDITKCNSIGRKTQQQTTVGNCDEDAKTREINCEYLGDWGKVGGCGSDGQQWYSRVTVNSEQDTREPRKCCYTGGWGGWQKQGTCGLGQLDIEVKRTRRVVNPELCTGNDRTTEETDRVYCNRPSCDYYGTSADFEQKVSENYHPRINRCHQGTCQPLPTVRATFSKSGDEYGCGPNKGVMYCDKETKNKYLDECAQMCNDAHGCEGFSFKMGGNLVCEFYGANEIYTHRYSSRGGGCWNKEVKKFWRKKNNSSGVTKEKLETPDVVNFNYKYGFVPGQSKGYGRKCTSENSWESSMTLGPGHGLTTNPYLDLHDEYDECP